jgi:hypothetical protein
MLIFVIAVAIVVGIIVVGIVIAAGSAGLDNAVRQAQLAIENRDRGYNMAVTLGHRIKVEAEMNDQLKEARILAAKLAAGMPRGANMGIGRLGSSLLKSAGQGLEKDPQTAVKIAAFHGWEGARTGAVASAPVATVVAVASAPAGEIKLQPGKDYPVVEITDGMSPAEKRKARIANAKAKSAAMKAAKAAQTAAVPGVAVPAAAAATATPAAVVSPGAALPAPPVPIELTDDMSPDEKRKARIANAKAKSAYNKALKAAGGTTPAPAPAPVEATTAPPSPEAPGEAPQVASAADIPAPDYIDLTDDMSPDEKRKARIQNAKARSAYNKALKAAGIDPRSVK